MPAPSTLPSFDTNASNQPASFPAALTTDGFPEKYNAANVLWNYMFRLIGLWIAWLRSGSVLLHTEPIASTTTQISSADATETVVGSYTLPGGTIPATGKFRLRIRGTYHANATANATSIAVWVRIGTTTLAGDLFLQTGFTPAGTAGSVSFEIEISGESDGGTSTEGVAEQRVVLWDGTPGGYKSGLGTAPVLYLPGGVDIDHTADNLIEVTTTWDDVATGSPDGRLAGFHVDFSLDS